MVLPFPVQLVYANCQCKKDFNSDTAYGILLQQDQFKDGRFMHTSRPIHPYIESIFFSRFPKPSLPVSSTKRSIAMVYLSRKK